MDFGEAIRALKEGNKVAREGWNGKGMFIALMPGFVIPAAMINERTRKFVRDTSTDLNCGGYIVMWTAQQVWQPGWLASQADMLAEDWRLVVGDDLLDQAWPARITVLSNGVFVGMDDGDHVAITVKNSFGEVQVTGGHTLGAKT